jgi:hypothetical protein
MSSHGIPIKGRRETEGASLPGGGNQKERADFQKQLGARPSPQADAMPPENQSKSGVDGLENRALKDTVYSKV